MDLTVTHQDAALVVEVSGRLDSTTSTRLEEELVAQIAKAERRLVLDCTHLAYVTSAGLRTVLVVAKKLKNADGALVLCALNAAVWKVFDVAGFTRILAIVPTLDDALAELRGR